MLKDSLMSGSMMNEHTLHFPLFHNPHAYFHICHPISLWTGIEGTFENDLICPLREASEGNMAHFTSLVKNTAWRFELPSHQLISQWKSHFPMWRWYNVLSLVMSQGHSTVEEGPIDMLTASLLETIISTGSIVRPTPRLADCTAFTGCGGLGVSVDSCNQGKSEQHRQSRWMIACCVRYTATHLLQNAVSESNQWVDAALQVLQATYWQSSWTSSVVRYFMVILYFSTFQANVQMDWCECEICSWSILHKSLLILLLF